MHNMGQHGPTTIKKFGGRLLFTCFLSNKTERFPTLLPKGNAGQQELRLPELLEFAGYVYISRWLFVYIYTTLSSTILLKLCDNRYKLYTRSKES